MSTRHARLDDPDARWWLLHKAIDGDFLNAESITQLVRGVRLQEVAGDCETDPELTESVGGILEVMTWSEGMGVTLSSYEHAVPVLAAYHRAVSRHGPTVSRYGLAARIAHYMGRKTAVDPASSTGWEAVRSAYRGLLDQDDWWRIAVTAVAEGDVRLRWIADSLAPEIGLVLGPES